MLSTIRELGGFISPPSKTETQPMYKSLFELQSLFGPRLESEEFTFSGKLPSPRQWLLCGQEESLRNFECGWTNGRHIYWSQ